MLYIASHKFIFSLVGILTLILAGFLYSNFKPDTQDRVVPAVDQAINSSEFNIPNFLQRSFPDTDFNTADIAIQKVLSGGPPKDGIPALNNPAFVPLTDFTRADSIQAIVMEVEDQVKVYPYNILNWHEIVNDTVAGRPVAVTFCPLCGSAIVFDRALENGEIVTLGVSGALIESNMVMFDRETESLWQQSTGVSLAGEYVGERLALAPFQLLSVGEIRTRYPNALVLSEATGHQRDYGRNPYSGYETNDQFIFSPSTLDAQFPAKEIMVAFRVGDIPVATPWLVLREKGSKRVEINGQTFTLTVTDKELVIRDEADTVVPFYFEMWFSFAVQHGDTAIVI